MTEVREQERGAANPDITRVADLSQPGWHLELSHEDGWDCMQVASVNSHSKLTLPSDDPEDENDFVKFDGWRVTLDLEGIDETIRELQTIRERVARAQR